MFSNIGRKIRKLSVCISVAGMVTAAAFAVIIWQNHLLGALSLLYSIIILAGGVLISWVGSFFTYGFGEMIEKTAENNRFLAQLVQQGNGRKAKSCFAPAVCRESAPVHEKWKCQHCGDINMPGNVFFKGCGKYK